MRVGARLFGVTKFYSLFPSVGVMKKLICDNDSVRGWILQKGRRWETQYVFPIISYL